MGFEPRISWSLSNCFNYYTTESTVLVVSFKLHLLYVPLVLSNTSNSSNWTKCLNFKKKKCPPKPGNRSNCMSSVFTLTSTSCRVIAITLYSWIKCWTTSLLTKTIQIFLTSLQRSPSVILSTDRCPLSGGRWSVSRFGVWWWRLLPQSSSSIKTS